MPRPGTDVTILDDSTPGGPSLNTGQAFFVGKSTDPVDASKPFKSFKQYKTAAGDRAGGSKMYDAVNAFFQEGGGVAYCATAATEDAAGVTPALATFTYELGPGQVCAPGLTDPTVHAALLAHVDANKRCALLDAAGDTTAELQSEVAALVDVEGVRFAQLLAPQLVYPFADANGAPVNTAYSGIQAGIIARSDLQANPNQPAAGINGVSRLAVGLAAEFSDDDREALNEAGVTLAKMVYGDVRTYGARTCAGPADENWLWFANSRTVMAITHRADAIAQNYLFKQIDGRRQLFAALEAELRGMLLGYWQIGALYGATPPEAFDVDTGTSVNTDDTIKAGEVHATIRIKTSPSAEWVEISIVKVPVDVAVAA